MHYGCIWGSGADLAGSEKSAVDCCSRGSCQLLVHNAAGETAEHVLVLAQQLGWRLSMLLNHATQLCQDQHRQLGSEQRGAERERERDTERERGAG